MTVLDHANPARRRAPRAARFVHVHPSRRRLWASAGVAALALAMGALAWIDPGSLCALPVFVLALLLALRRYPGERTLAAFAQASGGRWPRTAGSVSRMTPAVVTMPRGGLLLACALAVRPPPAASRAVA